MDGVLYLKRYGAFKSKLFHFLGLRIFGKARETFSKERERFCLCFQPRVKYAVYLSPFRWQTFVTIYLLCISIIECFIHLSIQWFDELSRMIGQSNQKDSVMRENLILVQFTDCLESKRMKLRLVKFQMCDIVQFSKRMR